MSQKINLFAICFASFVPYSISIKLIHYQCNDIKLHYKLLQTETGGVHVGWVVSSIIESSRKDFCLTIQERMSENTERDQQDIPDNEDNSESDDITIEKLWEMSWKKISLTIYREYTKNIQGKIVLLWIFVFLK